MKKRPKWRKWVWEKLIYLSNLFFKYKIICIYIILACILIALLSFEIFEKRTLIFPETEYMELEEIAIDHQEKLVNSNLKNIHAINLPNNITCNFTIDNTSISATYTTEIQNSTYKKIRIDTIQSLPDYKLTIERGHSKHKMIKQTRLNYIYTSLIIGTLIMIFLFISSLSISFINGIYTIKMARQHVKQKESNSKIIDFPFQNISKQNTKSTHEDLTMLEKASKILSFPKSNNQCNEED